MGLSSPAVGARGLGRVGAPNAKAAQIQGFAPPARVKLACRYHRPPRMSKREPCTKSTAWRGLETLHGKDRRARRVPKRVSQLSARRHGQPLSLAAALLLAGCPAAPSADPAVGCTKDVDCKGDRVCEAGACAAPSPERSDAKAPTKAQGTAPDRAANEGPTWTRGGPGGAVASPFEGPSETPALRWEVDLGSVIFATPTILERKDLGAPVAYVGTHTGRFVGIVVGGPRAGERVLDLDLGARIWGRAVSDGADTLFVGGDDDTLRAIDLQRGDIKWEKKLGNCDGTSKPGPEGARCDVDGGPTIGPDGGLYVGADGLYKLDPEKGEVLWQWPEPGEGDELRRGHVFSTPVVDERGRVYFGDQEGFINAVGPKGVTLWRYKVGADIDGSGALADDGTFFVGADDGRIYAMRSDGSLRWSFVAQRDIRSSVAMAPNGDLLFSSFDANLYAIAQDGAVRWVQTTGGILHASPVVDAAGRIYIGSQDDHLYGLSPEGKVLWRVELPDDVDSSVAISPDGALVVGCDDGKLRAFSTGANEDDAPG